MKFFAKLFAASLLLSTAAMAQTFLPQQPEPPPPIPIPNAPQLPYHFDTQILGVGDERFGNVSAVTLRPNGNLLVFNRNPAIMMVEYDPTGTKVLRVFNPNIAMNPHALRVDHRQCAHVLHAAHGRRRCQDVRGVATTEQYRSD